MNKRESLLKCGLCAMLLSGGLPLQILPSSTATAQNVRPAEDGWKNDPVTLRISNETLGNVLSKVAKSVGADLVFQGVTLVGINELTTLNVKDKPLDKVIGELIGNQNVRIVYQGGHRAIIISSYEKHEDNAQSFVIGGVVLGGDDQQPLIGATVSVTNGTKEKGRTGCITDENGKFSLRVNRKSSISISYLGYETKSIQILRPNRNMNISLAPSATNMDEVVVTGISRRNKKSFTGNYVSVKGDELRKINPNNILKSLQFYDPSFKVRENNSNGSDPNAQPEFQMRGDQSLGSTSSMNSMDLLLDNVSSRPNTPLFVLDGFIVPMTRILSLDPERIDEVTILKDAAATAIYGSKASNGVVVISTKVAPDGALSVNYNGTLTLQSPDLTDYNMMNAAEKLQAEWMAGVYDKNSVTSMNRYNSLRRNVLAGVDSYWLSQPLRTAVQSRHSLTAAGGTDIFRYSLGVNAGFQPGVMKGSSNNTKGVDFTMSYRKQRVTVGANINLTETSGNNSPYGDFSAFSQANPYYRMTNDDGAYDQILDNFTAAGSTTVTNPLYNSNIGIKDLQRSLSIASSLNFEYMILDNLRLTESLQYTRGTARTEKFLPADHTSFANETDKTLKGSYTKNTGESTSWSSNLGLNYNLPIKKHLISMLANWTVSEDRNNYVNLSATGYPDRHMDDFIFGNKMSTNPSGSESLSRSMSFIGQVSYSYDNRYSFDFNLSEENSSRYANNSFTPFWSTGVRWNAYREKWLEGRISNLVFRATYGITGEQSSNPYETLEFYTFTNTMKPYNSFASLGAVLQGLNNPDLKWAKTDQFSLGVDIGFWKNRINATFNYYNNITRQMMTQYDLAPSTGFSSQNINAGELQNQGFDVTLNVIAYQNIRKQLYWTINANANHNKNKIRKISAYLKKINEKQLASKGAPLPVLQEGYSTTTLFTVRSLGIDPITGKEVFLTRDGQKTFEWNSNDKVPVGDTNPKLSGTISSSLNYNDLSFNVGFTYKFGGIVYNSTLVDKIENRNIAYNLDRRAMSSRWQKPGDVTYFKKFSLDATASQTEQSTRFIMDDDELKMSTMSVGYRMRYEKFSFLRKLNIDVLALNFTTNDLFRISRVKMERGLDYPFARSYTLSLSLIFK